MIISKEKKEKEVQKLVKFWQKNQDKVVQLLWPFATMTTGSHSPAYSFASTYPFPFRNFVTSILGVGFPMSS
jgi:hypothetical protein